MKISMFQFNKLVAATVTGLGIACVIAPSASLAQTSQDLSIPSSYQNDNFDKQGDVDSLFGGTETGNFNPMNLIHQANFGTLNWQEFSSQNSQNITSEAGSFREKQQRLLQQRQQGSRSGQYQQQPNINFPFPVYAPASTTPANGN